MQRQLIVKGHALPLEGRILRFGRVSNGTGSTRCTCGEESPALPSTAARKRWHREHKLEVVVEEEG